MLTLADPDAVYELPVTVQVPTRDGDYTPHVYTALVTQIPRHVLDLDSPATNIELVREHLVGWKDICDHHGMPLEYIPDTRARLMDCTYWVNATATALVEWTLGLPAKNSERSPSH